MRNEVLEFLSNLPEKKPEQFNKAFQLYRMSNGSNERYIQKMNKDGFSVPRLEGLLHELKKMHQITDKEILLVPAAEASPVIVANEESKVLESITIPVHDKIKATLFEHDTRNKQNIFSTAPSEVKTEIKLRDEFPFLNDPACPDELKALVTDKFTHYYAYVDAHRELLTVVPEEGKEPVAMTNDEIFDLAKAAVQNYEVNQAIWAELNEYKKTGKVLGKHPIFVTRKKQELIDNESPKQLGVRSANLVNYINRSTKELEVTVEPERRAKLQGKIDGWEFEQQMVEARLALLAKQNEK